MSHSAPADQLTLTGSNTIGRLCCKSPTAADAREHSLHGASHTHRFKFVFNLLRRADPGFTLMELVVVIAILALTAAIVIPLLPASDSANLKNSARTLASLVRYLGERSITTKTGYRLVVDLNGSRITVRKMVNGEETTPEDPFFSRNVLAEGVSIEDVELQGLGKVNEGVVNVEFGVAGLGEFMAIHLKGAKGEHFTVTALPGGGRIEVLEGYQEMIR